MEILDYLRLLGGRALWMLILPLVFGGIAGGVVLAQPKPWQATAVVAAPALAGGSDSDYDGEAAGARLAADLGGVLQTAEVEDRIVAETKTSRSDLHDGIAVTQVGTSTFVAVSFTSPSRAVAANTIGPAVRVGLGALFDEQLVATRLLADAADADVTKVQSELDVLEAGPGGPDPATLYFGRRDEAGRLENTARFLAARGDASAYASAVADLRRVQAAAAELAPIVVAHDRGVKNRKAALEAQRFAHQLLDAQIAQVKAAEPARVVRTTGPKQQVPVKLLGLAVGIAGVAGGLFGVVVAVLGDVRKALRRSRGVAPPPTWWLVARDQ